ncbi:MAG: hypothetical protein ABJC36_08995 [Gemmatimonadales bacterium]
MRLAHLISTPAIAGLVLAVAACTHLGSAAGAPNPLEPGVLRPNQAPIVGIPDVLGTDSLLGKRVRVLGWCAGAPGLLAGRRSGAWFLGSPDTTIEVRGLVPTACAPSIVRQVLLLVFAQVVPAEPGSPDRLLLRLPE